MHPKFILVSSPDQPMVGTFVYGLVYQHKDLVKGYVRVHGGGWYYKDDIKKQMSLYGRSGDYGEPQFCFLDRIPAELRGYTFTYMEDWGSEERELDLENVEWF
ncbi:MAG: hypothetical protein J5669_05185 [Bacteroidales bacterium]|nr:hypothetical protein [Bacteroidales bacterium]